MPGPGPAAEWGYQLAPGWPLVSEPGARDTCNWGSGVMAQSRPADHPMIVRRKTYPIKSLRNVLLWNPFWLGSRCHEIEMQWWFISLFSKNTISKSRNSAAEWQWSGVWSGSEAVIRQASSDTGQLYHLPTINCPLCQLLSAQWRSCGTNIRPAIDRNWKFTLFDQ